MKDKIKIGTEKKSEGDRSAADSASREADLLRFAPASRKTSSFLPRSENIIFAKRKRPEKPSWLP